MSKHEASKHQTNDQEFNNELAAFDSAFEEFSVPSTSRHEQANTTDPSNFASAIIDRIKAEQTAAKPYSVEDSYEQTLDSTNDTVNENISPDEQYKNEMAAFDKILGEYKAQEAAEPAHEFTAPSPADSKDTAIMSVADKNGKAADEDTSDQKNFDNRRRYGLSGADRAELDEQELGTDPTSEEYDEQFAKNSQEFAERVQIRDTMKDVLEAVKTAQTTELVDSLATAIDSDEDEDNDSHGSDTSEQPTPSERKSFWKRNVTERRENRKSAKANKADRTSRRDALKKSFMSSLKSENAQEAIQKATKVDRRVAGYIARKWSESKETRRVRADYKKLNTFIPNRIRNER